jgi:hypothetical protein
VQYNGSTAVVTYTMDSGYTMSETHLHVGDKPLPQKNSGKYTAAPDAFTHKDSSLGRASSDTYTVTGLSGNIYVSAHAVVTGSFQATRPAEQAATQGNPPRGVSNQEAPRAVVKQKAQAKQAKSASEASASEATASEASEASASEASASEASAKTRTNRKTKPRAPRRRETPMPGGR